ncbi:uncharacterized protein BDR25DRAFT_315373 [Lindgomyces ingoldianus]|uniref:Uncharacterized protein n=1 Tax=Lindgomyces ingoldianus TaxID=673940 RepID=A0ACB6QR28_9PLEO|nr:uncharacterized protein BDR25DRAFT_315373 [Lindgomyces ingoldianus]KAF2469361.1 hypothetical protein BDR25DRAFT_315373 [Lindgomyces ingoldianus]
MAAQSNGRAKKPKKSAANGHPNGHASKSSISAPLARSPTQARQRKGVMKGFTNVFGRLLSWYILITVFFRCPSSLSSISETSPQICKPYLHARSYAAPYLDPYYHTYIAPQIEKVQPYVDRLDAQVYTPVATFAKDKYAVYGAHRVDQAQKYLEAEWDSTLRPQLQNAQKQVTAQYDAHLAPHVKQASDYVAPYYEQTKESMLEIYHLSVLPAYEAALPYAQQSYRHGHHIVSHIIFPYVRSAREISWTFLTRTLWPQLRVLYGDNVEPQLVRIRERLGRYRDGQKIESIFDSAVESDPTNASGTTKMMPTVAIPSDIDADSAREMMDLLWSSDTSTAEVTTATGTAPAGSTEPQLTGEELREKLNNDLRQWQSKFAEAADKGAEDLEQRVAELTKRQVENGVKGHGAALVVQLEETSKSTIEKFRKFIKQAVENLPEDATEEQLESVYEKCIGKTRELGLQVKEKAQAVRTWKASYDEETDNLVKAAVENTLAVLDRIHGLGLQEVGMRWAWTDGVTYNDWQNYHKLRNTLTEWEEEVEAVGSRHEGLRVAHEESKKLEDDAMAISAKMVSELVRLKEVAKWKIWANDATDDFTNKKVPARAFKVAKDVVDSVESAASKVSESIVGSEQPATESRASVVKDKVADASSKVSEAILSSKTTAESVAPEVGEKVEDVTKEAKETISSVIDEPKRVLGGAMAQVMAEAKEIVLDDVIEDDEAGTYSEKVQSMVAEAGDRAADLSRAVSEALLGPSKTQGSVESITSLASEQYERAMAAASSVLYGTEQQPIESMTSVASEKFAQAVTAASYAIYGTPTPTAIIKTVQIQASSRYNDAISLANEQYSDAKSQLSELFSGKLKPAHETMLSMIEKAYSDSIAAASERLQVALQYTDSIKSYAAGPTQGYFESVSSIASSKLSEGISAASAQLSLQTTPALGGARRQYYEALGLAHAQYSEFLNAASTAAYGPQQGTIESIASVVSESASSIASEISGSAQSVASQVSEAAESAASRVSSGVIGTETPLTGSVASEASQNWEALIAKASTQIYGAPTPWAESIYSQAGAYGAQATTQAGEQYAAVQALISELVVGKEPDFTESVMLRFSSAYYIGFPAAVSSMNSYASENYEAATSYAADAYSSASSVVSPAFTPPPVVENILSQVNEQISMAVESASIALYGTPKGRIEEASESAASAYASLQSKASEAIFGTQEAQNSFAAIAASAQAAINEAVFGTPTPSGYVVSVTSGAESVYSSISSVASEKVADVANAVSEAIYRPEQGAVESARSRVAAAVEAANSRISEMYAGAAKSVEEGANSMSSVVTAATQRVKDEL